MKRVEFKISLKVTKGGSRQVQNITTKPKRDNIVTFGTPFCAGFPVNCLQSPERRCGAGFSDINIIKKEPRSLILRLFYAMILQ